MNGKWYGFDIDGTIADNSAHTFGMGEIGAPIKPMCELMARLHSEGKRVKLFTARLSDVGDDPEIRAALMEHVWKWCDRHLGFRPEITDRKDFMMECLYDDRAKQVVRNTGECLEDLYGALQEKVKALKSKETTRAAEAKDAPFLDKVRGCLFGGAVGDALGYPVEFMDESSIRSRYGDGGIREYELDKSTGKALISDDTQMTLFTANGMLLAGTRVKWQGAARRPWTFIAGSYEDWMRTQEQSIEKCFEELDEELRSCRYKYPHSWLLSEPRLFHRRAPGMTCMSAIRQRTGNWPKDNPIKHPLNNSKGCGGVMRVSPIALFLAKPGWNIDFVDESSAEVAALTHGHSLGYMPAAVLGHVLSRLARSSLETSATPSLKELVCSARDKAKEMFAGDAHIGELTSIIDRAITLAEGDADDVECIHELGEGWVGEEALAIALFCALRHQDDFSAGVIAAVNHKGDSDSTGAITGNILGAYLGYSAIEDKWKRDLELSDVILEIADDLASQCPDRHARTYRTESWREKYWVFYPMR